MGIGFLVDEACALTSENRCAFDPCTMIKILELHQPSFGNGAQLGRCGFDKSNFRCYSEPGIAMDMTIGMKPLRYDLYAIAVVQEAMVRLAPSSVKFEAIEATDRSNSLPPFGRDKNPTARSMECLTPCGSWTGLYNPFRSNSSKVKKVLTFGSVNFSSVYQSFDQVGADLRRRSSTWSNFALAISLGACPLGD